MGCVGGFSVSRDALVHIHPTHIFVPAGLLFFPFLTVSSSEGAGWVPRNVLFRAVSPLLPAAQRASLFTPSSAGGRGPPQLT